MPSSVTLIGPGAIGGALIAGLIQAGNRPTIGARTPFTRLQVEFPDSAIDVDVSCITVASDLTPSDIVIVATKATQNDHVADHIAHSVAPGSILVVAQNGLDHMHRFPTLRDDVTILPAIPMLPAHRKAPGHIVVGGPSKLIVPSGAAADALTGLFEGSLIDIDATDDWNSSAWFKLMLNAASGGIGVLARRGSEVMVDVEAQALMLQLLEEVAAVGRAEGAVLAADLPAQLLGYQIKNAGGHVASIVVDRLAGTPTEWRERNQIVVDKAAEHGIDIPGLAMVTTLIRLGEPDPAYITADQA